MRQQLGEERGSGQCLLLKFTLASASLGRQSLAKACAKYKEGLHLKAQPPPLHLRDFKLLFSRNVDWILLQTRLNTNLFLRYLENVEITILCRNAYSSGCFAVIRFS